MDQRSSARVHLIGASGSPTHSVITSIVPEWIFVYSASGRILTLVPWPGSEDWNWGKVQGDATRTLSRQNNHRAKQHDILGETAEISALTKDETCRVLIPNSSLFYCPIQSVTNTDGSWAWQWIIRSLARWWIQLQLFCQMWFHCLRESAHPLVPGMKLLIIAHKFSPFLLVKTTISSLLLAGKICNTTSLLYLRGILTI